LEAKGKDEDHKKSQDYKKSHFHIRGANAPKNLQLAIQVKKDWTLSWFDQFIIL